MSMDAAGILMRFETLKDVRGASANYWQQVADYMIPSREFTRRSAVGSTRTAALIFNTTPVLALEQLAGALHGMLTSPSLRWFALRSSDAKLMEDDEVREWFEAATDAMYGVFTSSDAGFDVALHEVYLDLAGFGNGLIYMPDRGLRGPGYQARPLAECYFSENAEGRVDTVFRGYGLAAREVVRMWPKTTPKTVLETAAKRPDDSIKIVHGVYPNYENDTWDETYVLDETKVVLEEGVYRTFPYAVARWTKRSGETYGAGPGMSALPDVKLLNKLEELSLRGTARAVDPTILLPDDGFLNNPITIPGGIMYYRSGAMGMDRIQALPSAQPQVAERKIELIQDRVRRSFYVDWLSLPQQPNMTATEVLQRRDEMLRLLGPMVARVTAELLAPIIARTFYIMAVNKQFPPMPAKLAGIGYHVDYLSPLATAQRASDAETVMRWFAALAQLAQVDPTVIQVVDSEAAARFLASRYGAPASVVRSTEQMQTIRDQATQQAQQQQEMQAAMAAGKVAQDGTGALANLAQAMGGGAQPPAAAA